MAGFGDEILLLRGPSGVTDLSSGGNNCTYFGGMGVVADTGSGGISAFSFDGTDDRIDSPAIAAANVGTGNYTIAAWVNYSATDSVRIVASANYGSGAGTQSDNAAVTFLSSENLIALGRTSTGTAISRSMVAPAINQWHLVCNIRRSGAIELWVNGTLQGSTSGSDASLASHSLFRFGCSTESLIRFMAGKKDDIRVLARALSSSEISAWHAAGRGYNVAPTIFPRRRRSRPGGGVL
jgi:sialidase-1